MEILYLYLQEFDLQSKLEIKFKIKASQLEHPHNT